VLIVCSSDVPDTFALLPRAFADAFFSLDGLVIPGVMCLGGPNFTPDLVLPESLDKLDLTAEERVLVSRSLCPREDDGFSERILKRKLEKANLHLDKGNIGFQTFFMAVVRPNLNDMCFYLEEGRLIGWLYARQYGNNAATSGCMRMMDLMRLHKNGVGTDHVTPVPVPLLSNKGNTGFESLCSHDDLEEFTGMNCLLDKSQTDWNFMPFRMHKNHLCITAEGAKGGRLVQKPCITNVTMSSPPMNSTYSRLQLFHFFPLLKSTQQLKVMVGRQHSCVTVVAPGGDDHRIRKKLDLQECFSTYQKDGGLSQQFLVRVLHSATADRLTAAEHRQFIVSAKNIRHAVLPAVSVVSIAHISDPADLGLLEDWHKHGQSHRRTAATGEVEPQGTLRCMAVYPSTGGETVFMEPCDPRSVHQNIVLERSSTVAWVKYIRKRLEHQHYFPKNATGQV
jgi:hypothetical protein